MLLLLATEPWYLNFEMWNSIGTMMSGIATSMIGILVAKMQIAETRRATEESIRIAEENRRMEIEKSTPELFIYTKSTGFHKEEAPKYIDIKASNLKDEPIFISSILIYPNARHAVVPEKTDVPRLLIGKGESCGAQIELQPILDALDLIPGDHKKVPVEFQDGTNKNLSYYLYLEFVCVKEIRGEVIYITGVQESRKAQGRKNKESTEL